MIRKVIIAALAIALLGSAAPAFAQRPDQPNRPAAKASGAPARPVAKASFLVKLIEASKAAKPFLDPKLAKMKGHLRPFEGKYNRFVLLRAQTLNLAASQRGAVKLPAGDFAITFLGIAPGKVRRVRYQVELPRRRTRMTRRVAPGGQTLDVISSGGKLTIVSTTVQ